MSLVSNGGSMKKGSITIGVILILVGALLFVMQLYPALSNWITWPMIILGIGVLFLISSVVSGNGDLAIPGVINAGIGSILLYQNVTNDWVSWSYMWTLIPAFIGLGILLSNLINHTSIDRGGLSLLIISLAAFAAFFFAEHYHIRKDLLWPAGIILVGILVIVRNMGHGRRKTSD